MTNRPNDEDVLVDNEIQSGVLDNRFGVPEEDSYDAEQVHIRINACPVDHFNFTYLVFYLLGAATMTPWNFFITAEDYWLYKFRNTTSNASDVLSDLTPLQRNFTSDLTITASVSGTTFLILNAIYGHHVPLRLKMLGTMTTIFIIFLFTTAFVEVNTDGWQHGFFMMTIGTVVVLNISSAVMSGGIFGIAGIFPSIYMTAVSSGQALGGIFTALAFILALTFGAPPKTTAFIYFSIGNLVVVISIIAYIIMDRQKFFRYYVDGSSMQLYNPKSGLVLEPNFKVIFGKIYLYSICMCLTFAVTLSVYPAVTVLIESEGAGKGYQWNDIYFMPVVNYLCFNSGDYLGRIFAGLLEKPRNDPHLVFLITTMRFLYIPLFMMSNTELHYFLPTIIHSDILYIAVMITFAISNGYLANIILTMVPKRVMQHEKEMASAIIAASLSLGLMLGAIISMGLVQLL